MSESQVKKAQEVACRICEAPATEACIEDDGTEIKNGVHAGRIADEKNLRVRRVHVGPDNNGSP